MPPPTERSLISSFLVGHLELERLLEDRIDETGLSALEALVLRTVLINQTATIGTIREALALRASTAGYLVGRLCERGYAQREVGMDRRFAIVRLTGSGSQVARMVDAAVRELDREVQDEGDQNAFAVTKIVDAIERLAWRERRLRLRRW
jgi:DNA-binding MarR family transcriptional regulator